MPLYNNTLSQGFSFSTETDINGLSSKIASYVAKAYILFPGTDIIDPAAFQTIIKADGGATGQIKIVDITNSDNVICESAAFSSSTWTSHDLGTLSNLPASGATFEIQIKRATGTAANEVHCNFICYEV